MEIPKITMSDLYNVRLVCFIEESPQSNKYFQLLFTEDQFKEVSKTIESIFPKEKDHVCDDPDCNGSLLKVSSTVVSLPEDIREIHACNDNE